MCGHLPNRSPLSLGRWLTKYRLSYQEGIKNTSGPGVPLLFVSQFWTNLQTTPPTQQPATTGFRFVHFVKGGDRVANPSGGGLSQEVTNRRRSACCLLFMLRRTFQNLLTVLSIPVNPPAYRQCDRRSSTSIFPSVAPLMSTCSSGSLKMRSHDLSMTSQRPLVNASDCSFTLSTT